MVSRLVLFAAIATSGLIIFLLVQRLHQGLTLHSPSFPHQGLEVRIGPISDSFNQQHQCDQAEKLLALLSGFVHLVYKVICKIYIR